MFVCLFFYISDSSFFFLLCIGKQNELNFSWQFELCLRQHEEERPIHSINFTQSQLGAQNYFRLYISACMFFLTCPEFGSGSKQSQRNFISSKYLYIEMMLANTNRDICPLVHGLMLPLFFFVANLIFGYIAYNEFCKRFCLWKISVRFSSSALY